MEKAITVIIHPTYQCNVSCLHCGVTELKKSERLPVLVGIQSIKRIIEFINDYVSLSIIFHGGEPLLMGVEYYKNFIEAIKEIKEIKNLSVSFQSNLLLYDNTWKNFLKEHKATISSSFDFFSNFRHIDGSTSKYYDCWTEKVKQYQDDFSCRLHVITVMSKLNKDFTEEIVDMGWELGLILKLNPLYNAGQAKNFYCDTAITAKDYGEILILAYKQAKKYKNMILFPCKDIEEGILNNNFQLLFKCPYAGICVGSIWSISPNGYIYNCGEDIQMGGRFYLGDFKNGIDKERFLFAKAIDNIVSPECLSCGICGGGCKLFRDKNKKTIWCNAYKMIAKEVLREKINN